MCSYCDDSVCDCGTIERRFNNLLDELEKRLGADPEPYSSEPPEIRFLKMLDKIMDESNGIDELQSLAFYNEKAISDNKKEIESLKETINNLGYVIDQDAKEMDRLLMEIERLKNELGAFQSQKNL